VAVVVVIVILSTVGGGSPSQETYASDGLALPGTGWRSSESTVGVPGRGGAGGSGQAIVSVGARWKVGSVFAGMAFLLAVGRSTEIVD
jgi:hypothetical protein